VVSITITTLDEELARRLEPFAPSPERRLKAVTLLKERGVKVAVRVDPVIPGVNDSPDSIGALVRTLAELGVDQIISSTYKAKPDNFRRLVAMFRDREESLRKIYFEHGELIRGVRYAPREQRLKILSMVRAQAVKYGIPFSVCREGLPLNTAPACDASHLLNVEDGEKL
jgi:DNA repair photolyase